MATSDCWRHIDMHAVKRRQFHLESFTPLLSTCTDLSVPCPLLPTIAHYNLICDHCFLFVSLQLLITCIVSQSSTPWTQRAVADEV